MEWDDLKHFLAVSRAGALTEAARNLKTSASTVARRIAALESKLSVRLFDRSRDGYSLTENGKAVRLKAEQVEEAVLAVEREALGGDSRPSGKVRIAASDDIATHLITPRLPDFCSAYPGIEIEIVARMDLVNLARREADIALRGRKPADGDFVARAAGEWPMGLYASRTYASHRNLKPGLSDLSNAEIITWTDDYAHVRGGSWFAEHAPACRTALASDSARVHLAGCKAGMGLAILPTNVADREPSLVQLLPPESVLSVGLWVVVHRDLVRTARMRAAMDFLVGLASIQGRGSMTSPKHRSGARRSPPASHRS
jgi:DNA-binding transcriptional LysR family regulator